MMGKQYASPSSTGFGQDFSIDQRRSDHFWLERVITAVSFSRCVVFFLKERKIINSSGKKFTDAAGIEPSVNFFPEEFIIFLWKEVH